MLPNTARRCSIVFISACVCMFFLFQTSAFSFQLKIKKTKPVLVKALPDKRPGQIPHSRIASGKKNISAAWLAGATERYAHGILGDSVEASILAVETVEGKILQYTLADSRVFEDLVPRLFDINKDGKDEVLVVESDTSLGASLSVYGVESGQLVHIASTPFLGRPNRWLNPVGVGDFDGDGSFDVALVATPHIGGILRLYRFVDSRLVLFAEHPGVSTHKIGSQELGLGIVVHQETKALLILPNQTHQKLILLKWTENGVKEVSKIELPAPVFSSFIPIRYHQWVFQLQNKQFYELHLDK